METIGLNWDTAFKAVLIILGIVTYWIRHSLSKEIEEVKNSLQKGVLVHKVQFEKEFKAYVEIWETLIQVRRATLSLRPMGEMVDPEEAPEDRRERKIQSFNEKFSKFNDAVEFNQPFYPQSIYEKLDGLVRLVLQEGFGFTNPDITRRDNYEEAQRNKREILRLINECCEEIRDRIRLIEKRD